MTLPDRLTVTVTQDDVDAGKMDDCEQCALARAARRAVGLPVWVDAFGKLWVATLDAERGSIGQGDWTMGRWPDYRPDGQPVDADLSSEVVLAERFVAWFDEPTRTLDDYEREPFDEPLPLTIEYVRVERPT